MEEIKLILTPSQKKFILDDLFDMDELQEFYRTKLDKEWVLEINKEEKYNGLYNLFPIALIIDGEKADDLSLDFVERIKRVKSEKNDEQIEIDGKTNAILLHSTMTDATFGFICDNVDLLELHLKEIENLTDIDDGKEFDDKINDLETKGIHYVDTESDTLYKLKYNGKIRWFVEYESKIYLIDNIVKYIIDRF